MYNYGRTFAQIVVQQGAANSALLSSFSSLIVLPLKEFSVNIS